MCQATDEGLGQDEAEDEALEAEDELSDWEEEESEEVGPRKSALKNKLDVEPAEELEEAEEEEPEEVSGPLTASFECPG